MMYTLEDLNYVTIVDLKDIAYKVVMQETRPLHLPLSVGLVGLGKLGRHEQRIVEVCK